MNKGAVTHDISDANVQGNWQGSCAFPGPGDGSAGSSQRPCRSSDPRAAAALTAWAQETIPWALRSNLKTKPDRRRAAEQNLLEPEPPCAKSQEVLKDQGDRAQGPEASRSGSHWTSKTAR